MRLIPSLLAVAVIAMPGLAAAGIAPENPVPEIDAMHGLAAIAAIGGVAALIMERRRKGDD